MWPTLAGVEARQTERGREKVVTRTRRLWAACGAALLVMAGCSGGDDDDSATDITAPPATGPTTTVLSTNTSFTGQNSAEFCNLARTYAERSANLGNLSQATPAQLRTMANEGRTAITQAANAAPPEIKADVQLIATTFSGLLVELERVNYDGTKVAPAAFAPLQSPEFGRASQRFQAYSRDVCKIS